MPRPDSSPQPAPDPTPQPASPPARFRPDPSHAPHIEPGVGDSITLVKRGRRHTFPCPPGAEAALLARLSGLVADPANDLTWFDAAVLSHEVGRRMSQRLRIADHLHPPNNPRRKSA